jgi:hypothetical protein
MKNSNLLQIAVVVVTTIFSSCSDDEAKLAKQLIIDGEKETLGNGYITSDGYDMDDNGDPISEYYILLTEEGLTIGNCEAVGEGSLIELYISSPSTYKLESGTYTFIDDEPEVKNTVEGSVYLNYVASTEEGEESFDILSGTMTVSKSGSSFKIKLSNLVLEKDSDGSEVDATGSWEGELTGEVLDCGS